MHSIRKRFKFKSVTIVSIVINCCFNKLLNYKYSILFSIYEKSENSKDFIIILAATLSKFKKQLSTLKKFIFFQLVTKLKNIFFQIYSRDLIYSRKNL